MAGLPVGDSVAGLPVGGSVAGLPVGGSVAGLPVGVSVAGLSVGEYVVGQAPHIALHCSVTFPKLFGGLPMISPQTVSLSGLKSTHAT